MKESIICIVTVLAILLLLLHFNKNIEPFVDVDIELMLSENMNINEAFADLDVNLGLSNNIVDKGIEVCDKILSTQDYLSKRIYGRCLNPRTPQEVREREGCMPVNIPSRDFVGGFYQMGSLEKIRDNNGFINETNKTELPLYQRRKSTDFSKMLYYTTDDYKTPLKFEIKYKGINCQGEDGCEELQHDDIVNVPELNASYRVKRCSDELAEKSNKCKPKYYPDQYVSHKPAIIVGLDY